jgi:transposase
MLELAGSAVQIADALKVKGLAPLACKTDRIGAWVLARCPAAI